MSRIGRWVMVAGLVAGLVAGTASAAAAKPRKQSTAKYAKTVCGVYSQLLNQLTTYAGSVASLDPSDPAAYATQATALTSPLIAIVKTDETTLQNAYPAVNNGKKIGTLLVTNATEIDQALTAALAQLQPTNPGSPTEFMVAIETLSTKISDPFSKVTDQSLLTAFQKEKTCSSVVSVSG